MKHGYKEINICLAGNPNCGKSSLFNNLTGLRQHVGNYPGVTVEKKEGSIISGKYKINIVDLPGIYSLSASSEDEIVARNFIIDEKPDLIIDVVDASNFERNLYLYTQLSELGIPVIIAMNMIDVLKNKGQEIDLDLLKKNYGIIAVATVASKNKGTQEIISAVIETYEKKSVIKNFKTDYGQFISEELHKIENIICEDILLVRKYPIRYLASNLLKDDKFVFEKINKSLVERELTKQISESKKIISDKYSDSIDAVFADKIYTWIHSVSAVAVKTISKSKYDISDAIDRIVLNKILALPVFALVMYAIFKFTFTLSEPVVGCFETAMEFLAVNAAKVIPEGLMQSFVVDGIIGGVGGVLGFFPLILFMFFAIAFFEDTGYMARAVFIMDRFMRKFGLHGKSFASMIIATNGCAVPGLMAARTIENKKDRLITLMVTPFMICGAKLPIFALFIGAFFSAKDGANIMFLMYVLSVVIALLSAWILKKAILRGQPAYFIMELPPYRMPSFKGIFLKMWERGFMYLRKAGTVILLMTVVIWAGLTFPKANIQESENISEEVSASIQVEQSYIGKLGNLIEPVIKPIGFDGKAGIALIAGLAAKEVVVSTLGTIYSLGEVDPEDASSLAERLQKDPDWNKLKAITFLIFCLIYLPCIVAVAVFFRETGSKIKWLVFLTFWTTVVAWLVSFTVYQGGKLFGLGG
ncbi:MAG: ferrous iron transport protein B [Endomicrobiaceae bacterium]|nr:ferrous iron transport protein B [Endomicrobiaceae bacterium]